MFNPLALRDFQGIAAFDFKKTRIEHKQINFKKSIIDSFGILDSSIENVNITDNIMSCLLGGICTNFPFGWLETMSA